MFASHLDNLWNTCSTPNYFSTGKSVFFLLISEFFILHMKQLCFKTKTIIGKQKFLYLSIISMWYLTNKNNFK